jgi:uncharacterized protein YndB with AHSA1/START domain
MPEHTAPFLMMPCVLTITRVLDASRDAVFEAFVDPRQTRRWLGPRGFEMTHYEADVRPGGTWRGCMRARDDGRELWHGGVYREIVPPERLAFTFAFDLAEGVRGPETLVTITLEELGAQTLLTFQQSGFDAPASAEGYRAGWESEFEQLSAYIARR